MEDIIGYIKWVSVYSAICIATAVLFSILGAIRETNKTLKEIKEKL